MGDTRVADLTANLSALRAIVGNEPREQELVDLLRRYPSVNQAANAFFDGSAKGGDLSNVIDGTPIAPPPQNSQTTSMVSVTCPAGITAGCEIQVQTHAGMMRVTVPKGVTPGTSFLVRLPEQVPVAQPVPMAQAAGSSLSSYNAYPGQQQMPPNAVAYQQQQPQVVVVQSAPYGYGYGYGYDPFLGGMMGFAGGMLIADAMFY